MSGGLDALRVERLLGLRQHRHRGKRSPHKPLLVLLGLGEFASTGSSEMPWSVAEERLARLIADFGPPSQTAAAQSAAYPFTRLRSDGVWTLDQDVPMDLVKPLAEGNPIGRFTEEIETALSRPATLHATARALVDAEFPPTVAPDVLMAVGLDPDLVFGEPGSAAGPARRRLASWPTQVLARWDRQCGHDREVFKGPALSA